MNTPLFTGALQREGVAGQDAQWKPFQVVHFDDSV